MIYIMKDQMLDRGPCQLHRQITCSGTIRRGHRLHPFIIISITIISLFLSMGMSTCEWICIEGILCIRYTFCLSLYSHILWGPYDMHIFHKWDSFYCELDFMWNNLYIHFRNEQSLMLWFPWLPYFQVLSYIHCYWY